MVEKLDNILTNNVTEAPKQVPLQLPKLKKIGEKMNNEKDVKTGKTTDEQTIQSDLTQKINSGKLYDPLSNKFVGWLRNKQLDELDGTDIISLREQFYKETT